MFLPGVKNIFASRTQILPPKHMFSSLATIKTMLTSWLEFGYRNEEKSL